MNVHSPSASTRLSLRDAILKDAMEQVFLAYGFTALRLTIARLEAEIARENRAVLALQGWVS